MHPPTILILILTAIASLVQSHGLQHHPLGRHAGGACIPQERDALLAFKRGITSEPTGLLSSWREDGDHDCCRWRGFWCSNMTGHVLKLRLISRSLHLLDRLVCLDLSLNNLQGSTCRIPTILGSLKHLKYLNLSGIPFSGSVTPHLGNITNLRYFDLSFMGPTHSTDMSPLRHLHFLQYLDLYVVNLSTVDDWAHVVNMIPSLSYIDLSDCSLTSANQSLLHLNLTNLEELNLSFNYLDHPIASSLFWNVTHLKHLILASSGLYGPIPSAIQDMISLQMLEISNTSDVSSDNRPKFIFTVNLRNLSNLECLYIKGNFFDGDITELIGCHNVRPTCRENWTCHTIMSVLPNWTGNLISLSYISLSNNNINGVTCHTIIGISSRAQGGSNEEKENDGNAPNDMELDRPEKDGELEGAAGNGSSEEVPVILDAAAKASSELVPMASMSGTMLLDKGTSSIQPGAPASGTSAAAAGQLVASPHGAADEDVVVSGSGAPGHASAAMAHGAADEDVVVSGSGAPGHASAAMAHGATAHGLCFFRASPQCRGLWLWRGESWAAECAGTWRVVAGEGRDSGCPCAVREPWCTAACDGGCSC
ncbi:hypothetical protein ACP4OV_027313 [Aristida adscensionis]